VAFFGDSVTFGVGVTDDQAFAQRVQNHLLAVRAWNSAVTGHWVPNYCDVVTHMLETGQHPSREKVCVFPAHWLSSCAGREEALYMAYTESGLTLSAIAAEMGRSVSRVSRLIARAEAAKQT
jgi:hypothetical protein